MNDALIELLKQRDNSAFEQLFNLVFHHIRYFCERIITDEQEAEDIAMQSFIKYYERMEQFDSINQVKSFLYITARNACFNYLAKAKVRNNYKSQLIDPFSDNEQLRMEHYMYEAALLEKIYSEVEKLPSQCRQVFKLYYFEGYSSAEIADLMKISTGTVHRHKSIALKTLQVNLSQKELLVIMITSMLIGILTKVV